MTTATLTFAAPPQATCLTGEPAIGDRFHALYAVRSGTFKSTMGTVDGREQVTGFQMGGDLLGLDALAEGVHATNAVALEDSEIVVLPYGELKQLAASGRGLNEAISRLLSREIVRDHRLMALRGSLSAGEKVAAFLLNMSRHMKERGYSAREFHLRMSRGEIGSYLGINLETVSRIFSDLQQRGVLEVDKRHVRIADMQALTGMFAPRTH
jgi:CRP/FNR family transcriptional regulator